MGELSKYYKIDYGENDRDLIYTAMIDLPDIGSVREKLNEFREDIGKDEDSIDEFVDWLNEHGIKAQILPISGTVYY